MSYIELIISNQFFVLRDHKTKTLMKNILIVLKFHVMTHYVEFIRKYETANEYNTLHDEINKYMFKKYYNRINKRDTFQK